MKIKVATASGPALDWMVAKCEGHVDDETIIRRLTPDEDGWCIAYSTNWSQGGPIIEREGIELLLSTEGHIRAIVDRFDRSKKVTERHGPTPLIAAMRCYVVSKLGEEVDVPEELI